MGDVASPSPFLDCSSFFFGVVVVFALGGGGLGLISSEVNWSKKVSAWLPWFSIPLSCLPSCKKGKLDEFVGFLFVQTYFLLVEGG